MDFALWAKYNLKNENATNKFNYLAGRVHTIVEQLFDDEHFDKDNIYVALLMLCRGKYKYDPDANVEKLLLNNEMSCMAASDLLLGMILFLTKENIPNPIKTIHKPVLAPPTVGAPVAIKSNIIKGGGGGRVLFNLGHTILAFDQEQIDFLRAVKEVTVPLIIGNEVIGQDGTTYQFDVNDNNYSFKIIGRTSDGLSAYSVTPDLN